MTRTTRILGTATALALAAALHLGAPQGAQAGKMCLNASTGKYVYTSASTCLPAPPLLNPDGTSAVKAMYAKPPAGINGGWFEGPINPTNGVVVPDQDIAFDIETGDVFRLYDSYAADQDFVLTLLGFGFSPWIKENTPALNPLNQASHTYTAANGMEYLTDVIFSATNIAPGAYDVFNQQIQQKSNGVVSFYGAANQVITPTDWLAIIGAMSPGTDTTQVTTTNPVHATVNAFAVNRTVASGQMVISSDIFKITTIRPAYAFTLPTDQYGTRYFSEGFVFDPKLSPVPEPSTALLLGSGLLGLAGLAGRRRKDSGRK